MNVQHQPTVAGEWLGGEKAASDDESADRDDARIISSRVLFNGTREVLIEHGGSQYRLKITRQNKLILNK